MSETLESLRASFSRSLRVEGKAERTVIIYGESIDYFSRWLVEKGHPADLSGLTREHVLGWLDALGARGLSHGTVRTRWRGLRRFVGWLVAENILGSDPLAGITVGEPEPPPVPIFTDEDLTALLDACKGKGFNDLRDAAVIRPSAFQCPRRSRPYTAKAPWPDQSHSPAYLSLRVSRRSDRRGDLVLAAAITRTA